VREIAPRDHDPPSCGLPHRSAATTLRRQPAARWTEVLPPPRRTTIGTD